MRRSTLIKLIPLVAAGPILWSAAAHAQSYPEKTITLVVPFPPGTPADTIARALAEEMQATLKQPVVVDNKPGAGQAVGASYVSRAPADGYTLLVFVQPLVFPASVTRSLPFSGMTDFEPVAHLAGQQVFLATAANLPASNLKELLTLLKDNPNKYTYGSSGTGSPLHLYTEMFQKEAGVKGVHVPYRSFQGSLTDMISGLINYGFLPLSSMEFVKQGKLKAIGVASKARDPDYPNLMTLDEAGMKSLDFTAPYFLVGPKGIPAPIVNRLNSVVNATMAGRAYAARVKSPGNGATIPSPGTPAEAGALIAREETRWKELVRTQGIELQ